MAERCIGTMLLAAAMIAPSVLAQSANPAQSGAADGTPGGAVPTIRTTARLVVFDVVVTDGHGHAVKGLKPSDFTVYEDDVKQRVVNISEHDGGGDRLPVDDFASAGAPEVLPPNTFAGHAPVAGEGPWTVIVLDNLATPDAPLIRSGLRTYLETAPATTTIAVFRIDWQGLHLVQDFTSDRAVQLEAMNSQRILPPWPFPTKQTMNSPTFELAHMLAWVPGRINLVWFGGAPPEPETPQGDSLFFEPSTGITPDLALFLQGLNARPNVVRLSRIAIYPIDSRGVMGNFGPAPDLVAQANGVPAGSGKAYNTLGAGYVMRSCQEILAFAISTGGKGLCNTNGFADAVRQVVDTSSHFYTVSYTPRNGDWNGKFRHIRVEVGDALHESATERRMDWLGLSPRVVYRDGYFARDPDHTTPGSAPARAMQPGGGPRALLSASPKGDPQLPGNTVRTPLQRAMDFGLGGPFDLPFKVTVTPSATVETAPNGILPEGNFLQGEWKTRPFRNLKLHYSLDPQRLRFIPRGAPFHDEFELVAIVFRDDGTLVNTATITVPVDVTDAELSRIQDTGMAFERTIAMPADDGHYFLRVGVNEVTSGRIGVILIPTEWIKVDGGLKTASREKQP